MYTAHELIERIRNDPELERTEFSDKFLNRIGDMCSVYGYGATRLFLAERNGYEAKVLLKILRIIEEEKLPFEIGKLILKNLNAIKHVENLQIYEKYR